MLIPFTTTLGTECRCGSDLCPGRGRWRTHRGCCYEVEVSLHPISPVISILIPKVVDLCRGARSPLTGEPVYVVAAGRLPVCSRPVVIILHKGGIFDGRGLAMALCLGAQAVWVSVDGDLLLLLELCRSAPDLCVQRKLGRQKGYKMLL